MTSPPPIDLSTHGYCVQKWIGHWFHSMGDLYMARRNDATDHIIREIKHGLVDDTDDVVVSRPFHLQIVLIFSKEVVILRQLRHPNIIDCSSCFIHGDGLYIITPNFPYGAITDILEASYQYGLPEKVISSVAYQTIRALEYIHSKRIVHRGVRGSHLLVDFHGKITLCGFRGAIQLPDGRQSTCDFERNLTTMLPWLAPELISQSLTGYNQKADIYSLGVTICELANGIVPFREMEPLRMLYQKGMMMINPRIADNSTCNNTATIPEHRNRFFSSTIHDFTSQCLRDNQYTRPSATQLLSHSFTKSKRRNCLKYLDMALTLNQVQRESTRDPGLVEILPATKAPEWDYRPWPRDDEELQAEEDSLSEDEDTEVEQDSEPEQRPS